MYSEAKIIFNKKPDFDTIVELVRNYSSLDIKVKIHGKKIYLEDGINNDAVELYEMTKSREGSSLKIDIEGHILILNSSSQGMSYIEAVTLAVLQDLGGKFIDEIKLPLWARSSWQGEEWWRSISKKGFFPKIINFIWRVLDKV